MNAINFFIALPMHVQYLPTDLRAMPNFPDIGKDNPYLMSRSDNSVIDAMPYAASGVSDLVCVCMTLMYTEHLVLNVKPAKILVKGVGMGCSNPTIAYKDDGNTNTLCLTIGE